jgi:hypothetical protein
MKPRPDMFWGRSGTAGSMADDLRLAHLYMDVSERSVGRAPARQSYDKARAGHDAVDRLLRRNLPVSPVVREELGAAIVQLRARLSAFERSNE